MLDHLPVGGQSHGRRGRGGGGRGRRRAGRRRRLRRAANGAGRGAGRRRRRAQPLHNLGACDGRGDPRAARRDRQGAAGGRAVGRARGAAGGGRRLAARLRGRAPASSGLPAAVGAWCSVPSRPYLGCTLSGRPVAATCAPPSERLPQTAFWVSPGPPNTRPAAGCRQQHFLVTLNPPATKTPRLAPRSADAGSCWLCWGPALRHPP